jgi:sulfite reductase alpha subunit-like flavoprotein
MLCQLGCRLDQPVPEYVTSRTVTLRDLFRNTLDFTSIPRKSFFELLRHFTDDPMEKEKFEEFCSPEGQVWRPDTTHTRQSTNTVDLG